MNVAIIAAAGRGARMGGERAKQFLELARIPIIIHTLRAFEQCADIHAVIVALPAEDSAAFLSTAHKFDLQKPLTVVAGGATRAQSVWLGLQAVPVPTDIVAVHDGARPFVTVEEISRTIRAAEEHEAAILVAPVVHTLKEVASGKVVRTLDRSQIWCALTPQCFRYSLLRRAYEQADLHDTAITDDSMLVERLGVSVATVEGSARNIKVTQPADLVIAEAMLKEIGQ
jgi:2-C-methyl-D-erythritol 4-phosphate cytidylyltransferase